MTKEEAREVIRGMTDEERNAIELLSRMLKGNPVFQLVLDKSVQEIRALKAELAEQKAANLALAERLAACSEVLGRAAERKGLDLEAVIASQSHKAGIGAVMGKWPGDETDAEIAAALEAAAACNLTPGGNQ